MSAIEFAAASEQTFTAQLYNGITSAPIGGVLAVTELSPTRYRIDTGAQTGIVYVVATSPDAEVVGYANLNVPGPNGFSELLTTYDAAYDLGSAGPAPPLEDIQPSDVREGITYLDSIGNVQTGTLVIPVEDTVLLDTGYGAAGTEFVGTLVAYEDTGENLVLANGQIRSPLVIGINYLIAHGHGFRWVLPAPSGLVPADVVGHFRARKACSTSPDYAWDSEAIAIVETSIDGNDFWILTFDLTDEQTADLTPGTYYWWVVAEAVSGNVLLAKHTSYAPLKLVKG